MYIDKNTGVYKTVHKRFHDLVHEVNAPRFVISFNSAEHFSLPSLSVHPLPLSVGEAGWGGGWGLNLQPNFQKGGLGRTLTSRGGLLGKR